MLEKLNGLCPHASITGCEEGASSTVYYTDETARCSRYSTEKVQGQFHGAGDVYAGAFVGALANGLRLEDAVRVSADFTKEAIEQTAKDPNGGALRAEFRKQTVRISESAGKRGKIFHKFFASNLL